MDKHFNILRTTRQNLLNTIDGLTTEQLNKIPEGYKNNIIWNAAHNLVVQQLLIYRLSNRDTTIDESIIEKFKKGSNASGIVEDKEVQEIKSLLKSSVDKLEEDYNNGLFSEYKPYETSYNITLNSTEEAIYFNNVHEGLHLGYIMAMKKLV